MGSAPPKTLLPAGLSPRLPAQDNPPFCSFNIRQP